MNDSSGSFLAKTHCLHLEALFNESIKDIKDFHHMAQQSPPKLHISQIHELLMDYFLKIFDFKHILVCSNSPPPLSILWVCPWQADRDGGRGSHIVPFHHLPAHLHLHQGRVYQPCQQPHSWLQCLREETGKGKVVRHVTTAPAVPLVKAQIDPARQSTIAVCSQRRRAVEQPRQAQ